MSKEIKNKELLKISIIETELGIDKVTPVAGFVGGVCTAIATLDEDKDGTISTLEILNKVQIVGLEAFGLSRGFDLDLIKAQWKDADLEEKKILKDAFANRFDLNNDEVELIFEDTLEWVLTGVDIVQRIVKLKKKETATESA